VTTPKLRGINHFEAFASKTKLECDHTERRKIKKSRHHGTAVAPAATACARQGRSDSGRPAVPRYRRRRSARWNPLETPIWHEHPADLEEGDHAARSNAGIRGDGRHFENQGRRCGGQRQRSRPQTDRHGTQRRRRDRPKTRTSPQLEAMIDARRQCQGGESSLPAPDDPRLMRMPPLGTIRGSRFP